MFFNRKPNVVNNDLSGLGELYHDYSFFGFKNKQLPGIYSPNQKCKELILRGYIQVAIAKSKSNMNEEVSFAELFCADGYYAMLAKKLGANTSIGIDNNHRKYFEKSKKIAEHIGIKNIKFINKNVNDIHKMQQVDVVANVGGLYHVPNPKEIVKKSYLMARKYLIIQTVVSLASDNPGYFETNVKGREWGSVFSRQYFDNAIQELGYKVIDQHFNELEGNTNPESRGSVYYLIEVEREHK